MRQAQDLTNCKSCSLPTNPVDIMEDELCLDCHAGVTLMRLTLAAMKIIAERSDGVPMVEETH